jgi:Xaa-Pro aminopeptidase
MMVDGRASSLPYATRRAELAARMQPGAVALLGTAPEVVRNGDSEYPYRHVISIT